MKPIKIAEYKNRASLYGTKQSSIDSVLYDRVRKVTHKTKEELPDSVIRKVITLGNKEVGKWLLDNPEGFRLYKNIGVLSVSKYLPKEFQDNKDDIIDKVKALDISESFRQIVLKRYQVDIGRRIDIQSLVNLKKRIPRLSLHSFFYIYKVMWFNHRNCNFLKSQCYRFQAAKPIKKGLFNKIMEGIDYYEWNFNDFYDVRLGFNETKKKRIWNKEQDNKIEE